MSKRPRPLLSHPTDSTLVLVPLTRGYIAVISEQDADAVARHCWCANPDGSTVYAKSKRRVGGRLKQISLHVLIAELSGISTLDEIDHKNGNGLDCRRTNLRVATKSGNQKNRRLQKNNTSGVKGVYAMPGGRWRAQLNSDGTRHRLGCFATLVEAEAAIAEARERLHGEFANHGTA
jgi:hypothetical protein